MASRVAIVFRGDRSLRNTASAENTRLAPIFAALTDVGLDAEPAVYDEPFAGEVRTQLLAVKGVLVWVDPLSGGKDRSELDPLLREVAASGVWVSAHPDVILAMGTKDVLHATRGLAWGTDTDLYASLDEMRDRLPARLASGPRVLKPHRGNAGIGVWKVELLDEGSVRVQHAQPRDEVTEDLDLDTFHERCVSRLAAGPIVDQPFQRRITEGLTRCYFSQAQVVGFSRQHARDASSPRTFGLPGEKTMYGPDEPAFKELRDLVESEVPRLQHVVGVDTESLPAIWDADFLFGDDGGYVLCEINISAVLPFPAEALPVLATTVRGALA